MTPRLQNIASLLLAMMALLLAPAGALPPDLAIYHDNFQPSRTKSVATIDGQPITEFDVYIWQTMVGGDALCVKNWEEAAGPAGRAQRMVLTSAVRGLAETAILCSTKPEETTATKEIQRIPEELGSRLTSYNVARMIWAENVVAPTVDVTRSDVLFAYQQSRGRFSRPATAVVRRLHVPLEQPITQAGRDRARARIREIHDEAVRGSSGLLPFLDQDPALRESPAAPYVEDVKQGSGQLESLVDGVVFSLPVGSISEPIETTSSLVLVEVIDRAKSRPEPLSEVEATLREELKLKFLPQQVDYTIQKGLKDVHPLANRGSLYSSLAPEAEIVQAGRFRLTRRDFGALFTEVVQVIKSAEMAAIGQICQNIIEGEFMMKDLESRGLTGDPRYQHALEISRRVLLATHHRRLMNELSRPTKKEVEQYIKDNKEKLSPKTARTVWAVRGSLVNVPKSTSEWLQLRRQLEAELERTVDAAGRQIGDRVDTTQTNINPAEVVARLPKPKDQRILISVVPLGDLNCLESQEKFGFNVEELELGSFSPILTERDGTPASYFVSAEKPLPHPTKDELRQRAQHAIFTEKVKKTTAKRIDEAEKSGRLVWKFEPVVMP